MKKLYIRRTTEILIAIFLILYALNAVSTIVRPKDPGYVKSTFMENANDIDVMFLETSHMINAVFPMELWNNYGIASYNMAGHGNTIANSYWVMINALDYSNPKLVVLDCLDMSYTEKTTENYLHWSMDSFKLSKNKIRAVNDLFTDPIKRQEYLFDFSLYHSRWSEVEECDFRKSQDAQYGSEQRVAVAVPHEMTEINAVEKQIIDTSGIIYLRKIIEECQSRNIDILLIYLPFPASEGNINESLNMEDIAKEYGINCLNFLRKDVVDFGTDCYDESSHLNPSGAEKVTRYLGNYIQSNYEVKDNRENELYKDWNENYRLYEASKIDVIKEQTDLATYLMLLHNPDISFCMYLKGDSDIFKDERMLNLIDNIPIDKSLEKLDQAIEEKREYFLIIDNGGVWETLQNEKTLDVELSFGSVYYSNNHDDKILSIKNSQEKYLYEPNDKIFDEEMQIFVIDKKTNEIADVVTYLDNQSCELIRFETE